MKKIIIASLSLLTVSTMSCVSSNPTPPEQCNESVKRFLARHATDGLEYLGPKNIGPAAALIFSDKRGDIRGMVFGSQEDFQAIGQPPNGRYLSDGECTAGDTVVKFREFEIGAQKI